MQPNEDVVRIEAVRDRYEGGGGPEKYVGALEKLPIESSRGKWNPVIIGRRVLPPPIDWSAALARDRTLDSRTYGTSTKERQLLDRGLGASRISMLTYLSRGRTSGRSPSSRSHSSQEERLSALFRLFV